MNWTNFIIYLSIAYLIYYALMLILDILKSSAGDQPTAPQHYEIPGLELPIDASIYSDEHFQADQTGTMLSSGLIESPDRQAFEGLMALVAAESVEYTKKIPY